MKTKLCSKCEQNFPVSSFYKRTGAKTYHSACKACERAMARSWYERNRDVAKEKVKDWRLRNGEVIKQYRAVNRQKSYRQELVRKHGVKPDWFDSQIAKQGNMCPCCKRAFEWGNKQTTPHVDHCHETGVVRGILCNRCNTVLGLCSDDPKLLQSLARYLKKCHGYSAEP